MHADNVISFYNIIKFKCTTDECTLPKETSQEM